MIGKYPKCYNKYTIQNKNEYYDEQTKIKQNKRKLIYSQAHVEGTDHLISGSSCDQISPARRTMKLTYKQWISLEDHHSE